MTLDEYKAKVLQYAKEHNDVGANLDQLFAYADDKVLQECMEKDAPLGEVVLYCMFAGLKMLNKKK